MYRVDIVELLPDLEDLLGVDGDVASGAQVAAARLVDHDGRVGEAVALAGGAAGEQQRAHGRGLPEAGGLDLGLDVLHRVVDGEPGRDRAAGRVDVQADGLFGVVGVEVEEHGDDGGGGLVVDGALEHDDALF